MAKKSPAKKLGPYRAKRAADRTPEPFGGDAGLRPGLFVVQKHAARQLHYDFRLELDGVLVSWAVPRGPSNDPADKRLAVHVEDHPVEYADFEGVIPADNYGAGEVIVWDQGRWVPREDARRGLDRGKLLFDLHGFKLHGLWTLVRTKRSDKEWLLIKKPDGYARSGEASPEESVFSGRRLEDLKEGGVPYAGVVDRLDSAGARRGLVRVAEVELMLAELRDEPFSRAGWLFELKYDGYRLLAGKSGGAPELRTRRGQDATALFPEIVTSLRTMPCQELLLDGEVVVHDETGRPSFQRLQKRARLTRPTDIGRMTVTHPAVFHAFDLLGFEGYDLRRLPLSERKAILRDVVPRLGPVRFADHVEERGEEFYEEVRRMGLEGIVAKKADAPYRGRRSSEWIKLRVERTGDFAVVGYTRPKRGRVGVGALHLAVRDGGRFLYAGRVGTGMTDRQLQDVRDALDAARRDTPPCDGPVPGGGEHVWARPELVCEVRFKEWTETGQLRQPVFLRFRSDKKAADCRREGGAAEPDAPPAPDPPARAERAVRFTNLEKTFWPEEGYTKGDLIDYYRAVTPWLIPYLRDRPVVMTRYPDGITGKSFFQKDAPGFAPDWIRTETMWSEHASREIDYFICDDEPSLLYVINLGTIPLHVWASRVGSLQNPDWCILDLDPKGAPFRAVIRVAVAIRRLCDDIGLPCHAKTSGSTGLHVMIPLGRQCTFEQCKLLGALLARIVAAELPGIATIARSLAAREGRVYIDYLQNGHGKLLAAPLSARPVPGALVSTPLKWTEVTSRLDPDRFTIRTVPARLKRMKGDPLAPILDEEPDLIGSLKRLADRLDRTEED